MNCKKCGYPIHRGQKTCPSCGKPVRRHGFLRTLIGIILVLALAAAVVLNIGTVRNLAAQRRLSPAEYYRTVEKENCEGLFRTLSLLEKAVGGAAGTHRAATLDLQLGDTARQLLQAVSRTVRLDWIRGLSLKAETNTADGRLGVNAAVTLNGTPLVSVDALADTGTGTLTVSIPELSENTLSLSAEDLGIGLSDLEKLLQGRSDRGEDSALLQKYVELAAGQVRDVEIGRADLEAEGVSRTYTTLTVKLNGEELRAATLAVCEELSGDELILSRLRAASARAESTFVNALQTLCERLRAGKAGGGSLTMVVYVNAHGTICGRSIRFSPEDGGEIALQAALVRKGLRCGFELSANDGRESAQLHGSARLRGRTLSGNAYIHRNGVALTKTDLSAVLRGLIRLELEATVRPTEGLAAALSLPADTAKDVQELALTVRGDNLGGLPMGSLEVLRGSETALSLSLDRQQLAAAALPSQAEGQSLEEWRSGIKLPGLFGSGSFETIFENLKNAGMPGELLTILKVALPRLLK